MQKKCIQCNPLLNPNEKPGLGPNNKNPLKKLSKFFSDFHIAKIANHIFLIVFK
jgi:hypothetical protein